MYQKYACYQSETPKYRIQSVTEMLSNIVSTLYIYLLVMYKPEKLVLNLQFKA